MAAIALWNAFLKILRLESQNHFLTHGLQTGYYVSRHGNINLVGCLHQSSWVTRCIVKEKEYFERNLFLSISLNNGLKTLSNLYCKQMRCHQALLSHLGNTGREDVTSFWRAGGSSGKNLPPMQKTWVWSLRQEDSLKKEMATHSSTPA